MNNEKLTTKQAATLYNIPLRTIQTWKNIGYIAPIETKPLFDNKGKPENVYLKNDIEAQVKRVENNKIRKTNASTRISSEAHKKVCQLAIKNGCSIAAIMALIIDCGLYQFDKTKPADYKISSTKSVLVDREVLKQLQDALKELRTDENRTFHTYRLICVLENFINEYYKSVKL